MKQTLFFDTVTKSLNSFRDGVQEYLGYEIDKEPAGKIFTVYRSSETVNNANKLMKSINLTDEHIPLDSDAANSSIGSVTSSDVKPLIDKAVNQTVVVQNKIKASSELLKLLDSGTRELSLGYRAEMTPHDAYDFQQTNIKPHHLAVVDAGRCGSVCSFNDKMKVNKMTEDEQKVADEAAKKLKDEEARAEAKKLADEEAAKKIKDEEGEKPTVEKGVKPDFSDSLEFHDAVKAAATEMAKDMTDKAMAKELPLRVVEHGKATEKARQYLDDAYAFADKTPCQIKRDVLATVSERTFNDAELDAAFEVLQFNKDYSKFADATPNKEWADMANEEVGA